MTAAAAAALKANFMGVVGGKIVQERSLARAIAVPPVKKSQVKLSQVKSSTFRALLGRPLDGESNLGWHVPHCPSLHTQTHESSAKPTAKLRRRCDKRAEYQPFHSESDPCVSQGSPRRFGP
jgi:hypothetical protein